MPIVQTFEAAPALINVGDISSLRWDVSNAQSVNIDNGIGEVAISGTAPVSPNATTIYTLTAKNTFGIATASTKIIVRNVQSSQPISPTSSAPKINLFLSDRLSILPGEYIVLRWDVLEATQVVLNPIGIVDTMGEIRVYPTKTTTYTLAATNAIGDSTASFTIIVLDTPTGESTNLILGLNALPDESGSLIKGTQHLDYFKQDAACVGDTSSSFAGRAFLSFDISPIPSNAVIEEAILDLSQYKKTGDPTYVKAMWGNMGALEVYHLQYGGFDDLGFTDYNQVAKLTHNGAFIDYPLSPWAWDVKDANDGTPVIQNLVQTGALRCQFRI